MSRKRNYQLFGRLRREEYAALEADILKRGVMVPVEKDEDGNTLDGHHREEIAEKHGLKYPTVTRRFKTEEEKQEHVIKLNLARRHLEPWEWGQAFKKLLEAGEIELLEGADAPSRVSDGSSARLRRSTHGHRANKGVARKGDR